MTRVGRAFDWRGFWADLLQGAGRGLLELDGGDAARAALSGLDHFEAARRRRVARRQAADEPAEPASEAHTAFAQELLRQARSRALRADSANRSPDDVHGLAASVRPAPRSANPYDSERWPLQAAFPQLQPMIRRR